MVDENILDLADVYLGIGATSVLVFLVGISFWASYFNFWLIDD